MTTKNNARPDEGTGAEDRLATCSHDTADTRPRCGRCHHPLEAHRSVARGFGPVCWTRTELGALDRARDQVGRRLDALARRVARMDLAELATASAALSYAEGVTA